MRYAIITSAIGTALSLSVFAACGGNDGISDLIHSDRCTFAAPQVQGMEIEQIWPDLELEAPTRLRQGPVGSRWYVSQLEGQLLTFTEEDQAPTVVLDITSKVQAIDDAGFTSFALSPNFATNGEIYVAYTGYGAQACKVPGCSAVLRLSRFRSTDGGLTVNPVEEPLIAIDVTDPVLFHVNADIAFDAAGLLYVGFGDGELAINPAQQMDSLLGKILRIDVTKSDPARMKPYAIPPGNPFAGSAAPEIYAYGFRNPWRMSFDRANGDLWAGDVGNDDMEEVDKIVAGGNYGWPLKEGSRCTDIGPCDGTLIDPVFEIPHRGNAGSSVTFGAIYRGKEFPSLSGKALYADFITGRIWASTPGQPPQVVSLYREGIVSFAESRDGEPYFLDLILGRVLRLNAGTLIQPALDTFPKLLSQTGCVNPQDPRQPGDALLPYEINVPFWSDGAEKHRFIRLAQTGKIAVDSEGRLDLPVGTVLLKQFLWKGQHIETRLLIRHSEGWGAYTYLWNEQQTDAALVGLDDNPRQMWQGLSWAYPNRSQCFQCHNPEAGNSLGLSLAQLNKAITYPATGETTNQLAKLASLDAFAQAPGSPEKLPMLPSTTDARVPLEQRARAWLHSNCSGCHRPEGLAERGFDLRFTTPLSETKICNGIPDGGVGMGDVRLIKPKDPAGSLILIRMSNTAELRMPPIGTKVVDAAGKQLLTDWINSLTACP